MVISHLITIVGMEQNRINDEVNSIISLAGAALMPLIMTINSKYAAIMAIQKRQKMLSSEEPIGRLYLPFAFIEQLFIYFIVFFPSWK